MKTHNIKILWVHIYQKNIRPYEYYCSLFTDAAARNETASRRDAFNRLRKHEIEKISIK